MNDDIYNQQLKALAKANYGGCKIGSKESFVCLDNPLCGDRIMLRADVADGRIVSLIHNVKGCLLCQAAASAIGRIAPGLKKDTMLQICDQTTAMLKTDEENTPIKDWEILNAFEPVKAHRNRHNCVLLPFQAIAMALKRKENTSEKERE